MTTWEVPVQKKKLGSESSPIYGVKIYVAADN
jgi:hypothetical protein